MSLLSNTFTVSDGDAFIHDLRLRGLTVVTEHPGQLPDATSAHLAVMTKPSPQGAPGVQVRLRCLAPRWGVIAQVTARHLSEGSTAVLLDGTTILAFTHDPGQAARQTVLTADDVAAYA